MRIAHDVVGATTTFDREAKERPTSVDDKIFGEAEKSANRAKIVTRAEDEQVEGVKFESEVHVRRNV